MLTLIAARARNGAIGKDGDIPWHAPEDLKLFQRETLGGALVMGRRTWQSLPVRPLARRLNIVVTRATDLPADVLCADPQGAVMAAYDAGYSRVYGIGGAQIYASLLPRADRLLLTHVDVDIDGADTFFPTFNCADWRLLREWDLPTAAPRCTVRELVRL